MTEDPGCVFCRIVSGEAQARMVARFVQAVAFLPLRPAAPGHTLVIPRRHLTSPLDLDAATGHALTEAVLTVARRVAAVLEPEGLNIVQSTGAVASQTVSHLHVHVVPRAGGDGLPELWPPSRDSEPTELDRIAAALYIDSAAGRRSPAGRSGPASRGLRSVHVRSADDGGEPDEADGDRGEHDGDGQHRS